MQYRRLGSSGLQLSALSFGAWVTFGSQIGRVDRARPDRRRLGPRHQLLRQRRDLRQRRGREGDGRRDRRPAPAARRLLRVEQGLLRRRRRTAADPARPVAQARHRCLPRRAQAPARGLPRPLLLPPPRSGHADRGNRAGDGRAGPPGQGAVLGHVGMDRRRRSARRTRSPARSTCTRRRWSSRSTTCCTASASSSNTRRCTPSSAWAPRSGRRWRRAC